VTSSGLVSLVLMVSFPPGDPLRIVGADHAGSPAGKKAHPKLVRSQDGDPVWVREWIANLDRQLSRALWDRSTT